MGAAIPIQSPQIRPDLFQRPSGGEEGLAPLIQALEFYKTSKLKEQEQGIEQQKANSTGALQGAQTDALRQEVDQKKKNEDAWQAHIANAPETDKPVLQLINATRGLPPELQQVMGGLIAQHLPGTDPKAMANVIALARLGAPLGDAGNAMGVKFWDSSKGPAPEGATPISHSLYTFKFTPPEQALRESALQLRAQTAITARADAEDHTMLQDINKQKDIIAQQAWKTANPKTPPPIGVQLHYDEHDPAQVAMLHQYVQEHHYYERMQQNDINRKAATQRLAATASGEVNNSGSGNVLQAAAARLQARLDSANAAQQPIQQP